MRHLAKNIRDNYSYGAVTGTNCDGDAPDVMKICHLPG
jgi:hypothetical protein